MNVKQLIWNERQSDDLFPLKTVCYAQTHNGNFLILKNTTDTEDDYILRFVFESGAGGNPEVPDRIFMAIDTAKIDAQGAFQENLNACFQFLENIEEKWQGSEDTRWLSTPAGGIYLDSHYNDEDSEQLIWTLTGAIWAGPYDKSFDDLGEAKSFCEEKFKEQLAPWVSYD